FHFLRPYAFLALIPLIYLMVKNYRHHSNSAAHWSKVCDSELLPYLLENSRSKQSHFTFWLGSFIAFTAIFALAAPTWQRLPAPAFRNNSALVIALNLSESMNAEDVKPSRLVRARYKIADLLAQRKDGQTALLVYSGAAFTVTPLTNDIETIHSQLEALTTDIMPSSGNNTVAGIEKAVELLKQTGSPQGHILLITDSAEVSQAVPFAKKLGAYRLSILGTGTIDGAPIALLEGGFAKDDAGQILIPKLQTTELTELAAAGNGRFQIMTADDSDIKNLSQTFDTPLTQTPSDKTNLFLEQWEDSGYWLILLILPWAAWQFRKGAFYLAILFLLPLPENSYAFDWQNLWHTPDQQAQRAYQKQQFSQAAEKFENPEWKATAQYKAGDFDKATEQFQQSNNFYNQGNALAKKGQLKEALAAYEQAVKENPYDSDAKFNKEVIEKELEKQQQKNQENKSQDSKSSESKQNEKSDKDSQESQKKQGENKESDSKQNQKEEHQAGDNPPKKEDSEEEKSKQQEGKSAPEKQNETKESAKDKKGEQVQAEKLTTEQQQANEQWLKRIPDDPATLLKRKFKYQYSQEQ
ncbi:MAG: VWA domain-containing protein, partial [Methylococcales bacterium]|nr:VWA domain-containing protein [Methylococcales bacterium]